MRARPSSDPGSGRQARSLWLRIGLGALLVLLLSLHSFARATVSGDGTVRPERFHARASLEPFVSAVADQRFSLRSTLEPRASSAAAEGPGLRLSASLQPKSGPLCYGPGHIFADGFEQY